MAKRVKRAATRAEVKVTGMNLRTRAEMKSSAPGVEHRFIDIKADPTIEIRFEVPESWDGRFPLDPAALEGTRVKPVVLVPEELSGEVDRHALRQEILEAGAVYCKVPHVQVARRKISRDARHAVELPLEESLRIFAEETRTEEPEKLVEFAAALAREADAEEGS